MDRWKPWVTEAKPVRKPGAFPVRRQAEGQFFDELEIRNWWGIVHRTFLSVGFTQRSEGAGYVSDPESLFMCCVLFCFDVSSRNT